MQLNSGQKISFDKIIEFISSKNNNMFLLEGFAGTGKTFLMESVIAHILKNNKHKKIVLSAPTNKAVKVQGSTYKNVFLLEDDIDMNPNIVERNRIKYTAVTRPTENLFVIKM